jgi:hypothetical protein
VTLSTGVIAVRTDSPSRANEAEVENRGLVASETDVTSASSRAVVSDGTPTTVGDTSGAPTTTSAATASTTTSVPPDIAAGPSVSASVRDARGPVNSACVAAVVTPDRGASFGGTTDTEGFTRFRVPDDVDQVLIRVRDCSARSPAFASATRRITVSKTSDTSVDFVVGAGTDVIGTVVDRNGRAESGVTVMSDNAQYLASTTTGTDGHYQLRGLVPGPDAIDVAELGCSVDVTLIAGQTMTVDVTC